MGPGLVGAVIFSATLALGLFLAPRPAMAAAFSVDNTVDTPDSNPGDGVCRDAMYKCSLRAAVMEANALPGPDTIFIPAGTYLLSYGGPNENAAANGDLDITDALTITGTSGDPSTVIIDGGGIDKVFSIDPTWNKSFATTIQNVTIQNGHNTSPSSGDGYGGALDFDGYQTGTLTISNCIIKNSQTDQGPGGGIAAVASGIGASGTVTITHTKISGNMAPADQGGGLWVGSGVIVSISDSVIENNTSGVAGGGAAFTVDPPSGSHTITSSAIIGNTVSSGSRQGGGIYDVAALTVSNSTIANNTTSSSGGGIYTSLYTGKTLTLTNVTITGNTGAGLTRNPSSGGTVDGPTVLRNSIVAGNVGGDATGANLAATSTYNLFGTGGSGGLTNGVNGNQVGVASPGLGALTTLNGWQQVIPVLPGSPALDAGNNSLVYGSTDQRGGPRTLDAADADTTQTVDIGAYEASPMIALIPTQSMNGGTDKTVTFNIGDGSQPIAGLATSSNMAVVPNGALSVTGTGSARTLTIAGSAVSGGSSTITVTLSYNGASVSTSFNLTVVAPPDLTIASSHSGNFAQGQTGATYTLTVTNVGSGAASGTVTVTDTLPAGMTAASMAGTGWTCTIGNLTCTRSDALAPGAAYPNITLKVNVAGNAASSLTNTATVTGGGDVNPANNSDPDPTTVLQTTATTLSVSSGTYGDTVSFSASVTSGVAGSVQFTLNNGVGAVGTVPVSGGTAALDYTINIPAGTYTVTATFTPDDPLYTTSSQSQPITVAKANLTIAADDKSRAYGDANPAFSTTATGFVLGDTMASLSGTLTLTTPAGTNSPAGSYAITPGGVSSTKYNMTFTPGTLTITPVALTIAANDASKTYGDFNPAFTATYTGLAAGDTAASLSGLLSFTTAATATSTPGSYAITPAGVTSPNYVITFADGTLTVTRAPLTVTADSLAKTYGDDNPALTASYSGFATGEDPSVLGGTLSVTTAATTSSGAGTYPIRASGLTSANYAITFVDGTLTINPAPLTVTVADASRIYGDANPSLSVTYSGFVLSDDESTLGGTLTFATAATPDSDAGTYTVTPAGLASNNYTFTYVGGHLTISPAPLTITANDKSRPYGDANPVLGVSYNGFKRGQNSSVLSGTLSVTTAAAAGSPPDTYPITASGFTSTNYAISYVPGTLTVTQRPLTVTADSLSKTYGDANPALTVSYSGFATGEDERALGGTLSVTTAATAATGAGTYPITPSGLTSANYAIAFVDGTLTVNPAPLTITADNTSKPYGDNNPAFSVHYSPFVLGEDETVLTGTLAFDTAAGKSTDTGTYTVTPKGLSSPNYAIAFVSGNLVINKLALSVTVDDATKVYGSANPAFTASYAGFVLGQDETALSGTATYTTAATAASDVGTYTVSLSGLTSPNYTIGFVDGTLTINPVPLTITADDKARTYGDANPALTVTYNGFVLGEDATALTGTLSLTTAATTNSNAGTYAITPAGLAATNYAITFVDGTLTVNPKALTVTADDTTKTYGDANPAFTAQISGFVPGEDETVLGGALAFDTAADQHSDAGTYTITPHGLTSSNYAVTFVDGTLTVNPRALTITADNKTRSYGNANPTFTATYTGLAPGQDASVLNGTLTFDTTAMPASSPGAYPITLAGLSSSNYAITFADGTLTVAQAPLTVKADNKSKLVGAPNPPLTATYTGFVLGEDETVLTGTLSLTTTATNSSRAGTYPIVVSGVSSDNYAITFQNGTLTVHNPPPPPPPPPVTPPTPPVTPPPPPVTPPAPPVPACQEISVTQGAGGEPVAHLHCPLSPEAGQEAARDLTRQPAQTTFIVGASAAQVQEAIARAQGESDRAPRVILETSGDARVQGAAIDVSALKQLADLNGDVGIQTTYGSLILPPQVIADLAQQTEGGKLVVLFEPVPATDIPAASGPVTPASPVVAVTVAIRHTDGGLERLERFPANLTLTLPLTAASADPELAGIYRFTTDQDGNITGAAYVGGTLDSQRTTLSVSRESLSTYGVLVWDREYDDVAPDHWAHRAVKVMSARHVVQGVSETLFDPERAVTRAEFAAMVARAWSVPIPANPALTFADVPAGAWYAPVMSAVVQAGLYSPEPGNTLRPDVPITRQEMAVVIARAMERFYPAATLPKADPDQVLAPFADRGGLTAAARNDMATLVAAGLIRGRAPDSLAPDGTTTRAEAVTLIKRLLDWGSAQQK
jgi:hypothetical protein